MGGIAASQGCIVLLRRMYNQHRIGGKHIPERLCLRWIKNLPKKEHKEAVHDWKRCIKEGLVLTKQKPTERHVSLNSERLSEVKDLLQ